MKKLAPIGLCVALLVGTGILFANQAADWSSWRGPDIQTGVSPAEGWQAEWGEDGPPIAWEKDLGIGYTPPAVVGDRIYTMGYVDGEDVVWCLNAANGDEVWTYRYKADRKKVQHDGGPSCTPLLHEGMVFTLSRDGQLFALDAETGKKVWGQDIEATYGVKPGRWGWAGSVIAVGESIVFDAGRIIALDPKTGQKRWATGDYGAAYSTPVPFEHGGKTLLATFPKHGLVVVDAANGREVAKTEWKTSYGVNAATPIVQGNRIFVASEYGTGSGVYELTDNGLERVWANREMQNKVMSAVLIDGHVYGFNGSQLQCVDFATGEEQWSQRGLGMGAITAAGDYLIVLTEKEGELLIAPASPKGFETVAKKRLFDQRGQKNWSAPVFANGRIFARTPTGPTVAVDVRGDGEATASAD